MTTAPKINAYDLVELTVPVEDAPVGARGGVLEITDETTAMVEVMTPELDVTARIVFAPLSALRRVA